jgi:hypothetical protein
MSKQRVIELRDEMRLLLTKYGLVRPENFERPFIGLETLGEDQVEILYAWLLDFRNQEYAAMHRVFRLPLDNSPNSTELWDRYFELKKWHFPEMQMLRKEARITRDRWKKCPKFKPGEDVPDGPDNPEENGQQDPYFENTAGVAV